MKKKKNQIETVKKMVFERTSIMELNQLKKIKGGISDIVGNGGNDNTYSLTDTVNQNQNNYSDNCN